MIAVIVPPADERLPTALVSTDRVPTLAITWRFCSSFVLYPTLAVGAVGIFRTSNDGHGLLPLSSQPTILHAQHQQCLTGCFGSIARRSRLLTNHAPHAVAYFPPAPPSRGPLCSHPFCADGLLLHWAHQVPGEARIADIPAISRSTVSTRLRSKAPLPGIQFAVT